MGKITQSLLIVSLEPSSKQMYLIIRLVLYLLLFTQVSRGSRLMMLSDFCYALRKGGVILIKLDR